MVPSCQIRSWVESAYSKWEDDAQVFPFSLLHYFYWGSKLWVFKFMLSLITDVTRVQSGMYQRHLPTWELEEHNLFVIIFVWFCISLRGSWEYLGSLWRAKGCHPLHETHLTLNQSQDHCVMITNKENVDGTFPKKAPRKWRIVCRHYNEFLT